MGGWRVAGRIARAAQPVAESYLLRPPDPGACQSVAPRRRRRRPRRATRGPLFRSKARVK